MATRLSSTIRCDNTTTAFNAWVQFIEDTLVTTGGWVVTADAGQTLPASMVPPTAVNQKRGYRIYRMADSLQSTYPVFMRIDYGSANAATTVPGTWLTIGTGSDGSGTITGMVMNGTGTISTVAAGTQGVGAMNSYGSADTNRVTLMLFVQAATAGVGYQLSIERTKNSVGADTGEGLLVTYSPTGTPTTSRFLIMAGGTQPSAELGLNYAITMKNPTESLGGDIGAGVIILFKGVAQQPGTNVLVVNTSDVASEGSFVLTMYGVSRTYQAGNAHPRPTKPLGGSATTDTNTRMCIRYD